LLDRPQRLLTAVLFWNLIINIVYFALSSIVGLQLEKQGRRGEAAAAAIVALLTLIVTSEMTPKAIGVQQPRVVSSLLALPLSAAVRILDGFMPIIGAVDRWLQRFLFPKFQPEPYLELNDLERAITLSTADQQLAAKERAALQNMVLLSQLSAEELMRPRKQYRSYRPPVALDQLEGKLTQSGYVLVTESDSDEIASAIALKHLAAIPRHRLEQFALPVLYVPWCAVGSFVLEQLQDKQQEVAAVVNEMGETIGIVTLEDMLTTIFDEESSRSALLLARASIEEVGEGRWRLTGMTSLRRLGRYFHARLEPCMSLTVGGILQELLQRVPESGDEVTWSGFHFRVVEAPEQGPLHVEASLVLRQEDDA
ncbi:MAG: DUF21 domain-containing protein, partial [Planctomycetales bacterium]|nr:DUF21 domain-containing protein [Planctomycetales bacterium]